AQQAGHVGSFLLGGTDHAARHQRIGSATTGSDQQEAERELEHEPLALVRLVGLATLVSLAAHEFLCSMGCGRSGEDARVRIVRGRPGLTAPLGCALLLRVAGGGRGSALARGAIAARLAAQLSLPSGPA